MNQRKETAVTDGAVDSSTSVNYFYDDGDDDDDECDKNQNYKDNSARGTIANPKKNKRNLCARQFNNNALKYLAKIK